MTYLTEIGSTLAKKVDSSSAGAQLEREWRGERGRSTLHFLENLKKLP